jgi:transcriptional regulatory protein RtcR
MIRGTERRFRSSRGRFCVDALKQLDLCDRPQLEWVIDICRASRTLAEARRKLYAVSRAQRSVVEDSDRLKKYLARFGSS